MSNNNNKSLSPILIGAIACSSLSIAAFLATMWHWAIVNTNATEPIVAAGFTAVVVVIASIVVVENFD